MLFVQKKQGLEGQGKGVSDSPPPKIKRVHLHLLIGMCLQGQIGEPALGSVRPIHRADLHIIEPSGSELWLDVRIHTVAPGLPAARELL